MIVALSLLAFTSAVASAAGSADQCCKQRSVNSGDERGGIYSLDVNLTLTANISSAPVCSNSCIYRKNDKPGQLFCFGQGSLTSECSMTPVSTTPTAQEDTGILLLEHGAAQTQTYGCNVSLPISLGTFFFVGGATVYNGKPYIYNIFDGKCYHGSLESSATWDIRENCFSQRRTFSSWTTLGNFIMVTGGQVETDIIFLALNLIERYDGTTWTTLSNNLTSSRYSHCSVAISDTEMIVLGGRDATNTYLTTVEKYDSDGSNIKTLQSMEIARGFHGCTIYKKEIYVAGGTNDDFRYIADVEVYNIETNQWRPINKMNNGRRSPALHVNNNRLTVLGGAGAIKSIEYLDENLIWQNSIDSLETDFYGGVSVELKCPT